MPWVLNASDQINAQSKHPTIIAVCVILTLLMTAVALLRVYVHLRVGQLRADDNVIVATMIFAVVYAALAIAQTRYGLGLPLELRPKPDLGTYLKVNFAGRPFYQVGIAGYKLALCLSYLRVLSGTHENGYRFLIYAVAAISTLGHIAGAFVLIFFCRPVFKSWEPKSSGSCLPFGPTNYALAGFTIASDVVVIVLPIPILLKLQMRRWKKAVLSGLFLLGLFTTLCSILRLLQIRVIAYGDGNSTLLVLWGTVEFNIGIIISSVPFLAPLFKRSVFATRTKITKQYGSSSRGKNHKGGYPMPHLSSKSGTRNHGPHHSQHQTNIQFASDCSRSGSEEQILRDGQIGQEGIRQTIEYRVSISSLSEAQNPKRGPKGSSQPSFSQTEIP